jgi:hypothetical protein
MGFLQDLNCEIENDPNFTVASSLILGFLFSGISWGLLYVIIFLIIWEFLYFGYLSCNNKTWDLNQRIVVILAALLGYIMGAIFHDDDDFYEHHENFKKYWNNYGEEFGWF